MNRNNQIRAVLLLLLAIASCDRAREAKTLMPETAKVLVCEAAAYSKEGLKNFSQPGKWPLTFNDQPLTHLINNYGPRIPLEPKDQEEFRILALWGDPRWAGTPADVDISALTLAMLDKSDSPRSINGLREKYVTNCTCRMEDGAAKGTVSFCAPGAYKGKVNFVARRISGLWQVVEFHFPTIGLGTIKNDDGLWKIYEADHFNPIKVELRPLPKGWRDPSEPPLDPPETGDK